MNANRKKMLLMCLLAMVVMTGLALAEGEPEVKKKSLLQLFEATGAVGYLMVLCSMTWKELIIPVTVPRRPSSGPTFPISER